MLHCIGGFAVVMGYGLPRSTNDLDYRSLIPHNRIGDLQELAGPGSTLAQKHKVHLQHTGVESMPESYGERLSELFASHFRNLRLFIPDPYDLVLSKLGRNMERDREDVEYLAKTCRLDAKILLERYASELRPVLIGDARQHDQTLAFWAEAYFATIKPKGEER
ncbi:MAG TPA: DUF6036 family nucleotidyltransferase [Candidatus Acidoferrales bacterium]|nr:DUF6036 family nucleotidyltransferase [Candidatus Acidoferrales bacterium]